jgi:hypothetical protein
MLGAGLAATALAAETQPQGQGQPPIFRAGVDVVQLEVSVLDSHRQPVRGLTSKDFRVFENGDEQPVVDVQEFVLDDEAPRPVWASAAAADVVTNTLANRRLIAIVMDDRRCCYEATALPTGRRLSDPWAIRNALATARLLVDNLGPQDLATVALTRETRPIQPFINNREELRATIARFSPMSEGGCLPALAAPALADLKRLLELSEAPMKAVVYLMSPIGPGRSARPTVRGPVRRRRTAFPIRDKWSRDICARRSRRVCIRGTSRTSPSTRSTCPG